MKSFYNINPDHYYRNGHRIPGAITKHIHLKTSAENPAEKDRENRQKVVNAINEAVKKGEDLEKTIEDLALEYKDQFAYLLNNGIDLKEVFKNWYKGFLRCKENSDKLDESR